MVESVFPSLRNLMVPYLFKLKHLLNHYINLHGNFFDEIKSSHTYFDYMRATHQRNIVEITVYYKIVKKELLDGNEVYNDKRRII